jgi:hypothetical protein
MNGQGFFASGRVIRGTGSELGLKVEVDTAVEPPDCRGTPTALTSAVNACLVRVKVGLAGDAEARFDEVHGMLGHVTFYGGDFGWNAMA